jgi:hypothetical protein
LDSEDVERLTAEIPGWLRAEEGQPLYTLAHRADPRRCIVEIENWQGRSTIWRAAGAKTGGGARVYAIDPHTSSSVHGPSQDTASALGANPSRAGVEDRVEVLVATVTGGRGDLESLLRRPAGEGDHVRTTAGLASPALDENTPRVIRHQIHGLRVRSGLPMTVYFSLNSDGRLFDVLRLLKQVLRGRRIKEQRHDA